MESNYKSNGEDKKFIPKGRQLRKIRPFNNLLKKAKIRALKKKKSGTES